MCDAILRVGGDVKAEGDMVDRHNRGPHEVALLVVGHDKKWREFNGEEDWSARASIDPPVAVDVFGLAVLETDGLFEGVVSGDYDGGGTPAGLGLVGPGHLGIRDKRGGATGSEEN